MLELLGLLFWVFRTGETEQKQGVTHAAKQILYLEKKTENTSSAPNTVACVCSAEAVYGHLRDPKRKGGTFKDINEKSKPKKGTRSLFSLEKVQM